MIHDNKGSMMVESAMLFPLMILICMAIISVVLFLYVEAKDKVELDMKAIVQEGSNEQLWKKLKETEMIRKADLVGGIVSK